MIIRTIVPPGFTASTAFCRHEISHILTHASFMTYLRTPPPLPSVHVMIHALLLLLINIMLLRSEHQHQSKIGVTKQRAYTCDNISIVNLTHFVVNQNLMVLEGWPAQ
jgi:hypothetical protein